MSNNALSRLDRITDAIKSSRTESLNAELSRLLDRVRTSPKDEIQAGLDALVARYGDRVEERMDEMIAEVTAQLALYDI